MVSASLGITIYALFISLLVPAVRRARGIAALCAGAAALSYFLSQWHVPTGWRIVIATVVAAFIGAVFNKEEETS
jgi:predicted branched-subunit amino acid permease